MKSTQFIYGIHAVQSLLDHNPEQILKLIVAAGPHNDRVEKLIEAAKHHQIHVEISTTKNIEKYIGAVTHQGVIAESRAQKPLDEKDLAELLQKTSGPPFLLVLDGVQDPHNLGAILRTADAAGIDAVIVPKDKAVGLTATVQKVASGAATSVPFVQVTNLSRTLRELKENNVWIYGFAEKAETNLFMADFTGSLALVLGAEGTGLRKLTEDQCDVLYFIPMAGTVTSLNVSVAAGICLYEAVRQRSIKR